MKKFTTEFKLECVELITIQGYSVKQAAEAMNVGYSTLQKWLRQYKEEQRGITPKAQKVKESAKLAYLMDMLPELVAEGRRILVFSQFTSMLQLIEPELKKQDIGYVN